MKGALLRHLSSFAHSSRTASSEHASEDDLAEVIDAVSTWDACTRAPSSSTDSLSRGIPLGSLSGKAIMAVGNFIIRGIAAVDVQVRLRRIANQLGQDEVGLSSVAMRDLLELQR